MLQEVPAPAQRHVLVADDDPRIASLLTRYLQGAGFTATVVANGLQVEPEVRRLDPSLVLLDIMLPGLDGIEVCHQLRRFSAVPIIMVTARVDEIDRLLGLEVGADDYVCKPFSPRELVSRVRAVLRRTEKSREGKEGAIQVDDRLKIDFDRREVWVEGRQVKLRPTEYRLLYHLVQNAGWVVTHDQILAKVWGYEYRDEPHYVRLYVNYLREKLEEDPTNPKYILTERGVGYRFVDYKREEETASKKIKK